MTYRQRRIAISRRPGGRSEPAGAEGSGWVATVQNKANLGGEALAIWDWGLRIGDLGRRRRGMRNEPNPGGRRSVEGRKCQTKPISPPPEAATQTQKLPREV